MLRMSYSDHFSIVVRPLTFSNDFSSETPEPILPLQVFLLEPKWQKVHAQLIIQSDVLWLLLSALLH